MSESWVLEPETQITYQNINIGDANDGAATITVSGVESLVGRFGVRLAKSWAPEGAEPSPQMTGWVRASLANEFLGTPVTAFSSETGPVPFKADLSGLYVVVNAGVDAEVNDNLSFYANAGYRIATDGLAWSANVKAGFKMTW